jgi:type IV pilus assembly protein PilQ
MRSTAKNLGLRIATIFAAICITCVSVAAGDASDANKPPGEVPFEQRMQKKISVEFRSTPIEDVIRIMADQANVDIVKSPSVTGVVTCTLTDVPLEEALNNILSAHNYSYVLSENMIRVVTAADKTEKPEVLQTRTYEIVYADIKEVVKALDKFKSKQGMVASIEGTSHIIVTDTESRIRDISTFIEKVDKMTPQILVEARIYDITSKDKLDLGVEWNAGRDTQYYNQYTDYADGESKAVVPPGTMGIPKTGNNEPFATGIFRGATEKTSSTTGVLKFGWLKDSVDIDMVIKAQQNLISAKLLANPRILVLDNEKASINIVSEIPYQQLTESALGGSMGTTAFKEVGVKLEVTPHLAERDEMIRLQLRPEFSIKTSDVVLTTTSGGVGYPQPVIDKRTADTKLLVKNGQTVVLGGLRKKDVAKQINKVPFLGDLPLAGALFRFKGEDTVNSEIVVFVTPWIIKQPVMSQREQDAYDTTEFKGPKPADTKAEKAGE